MFAPPNYAIDHYGLDHKLLSTINIIKQLEDWDVRKLIKTKRSDLTENFIYKYSSFSPSDNFSVCKLKTIVVDSKLYLAAPSAFNDPYEFVADFRLHNDAAKRRKYFERMANNALLRGNDIAPTISGRKRKIEAIVTRLVDSYNANPEYMKNVMDQSSSVFGISSFSRTARSILMWSYYSAGHTGLCLQFNPYLDPGVLLLAQRVNYHKNLPTVLMPDDEAQLDKKVILSKSDAWEHEMELRYVSHKISNGTIAFDGRALTGVMLGMRFPDDSLYKLKEILRMRVHEGLQVPIIYKAKFKKNMYGIQFYKEKISI